MRLKALLLVSLLAALPAVGQGSLTFYNSQTTTGTSGGARVTDGIGGARLEGTAFWAQLYSSATQNGTYGAIGTAVNFKTGTTAGLVVGPSTVVVPGAPVNSSVWIQMRAWAGGANSSYESVGATGKRGVSNSIQVGPLGGTPPVGPDIFDPDLIGLQGFAIVAVPEPSTIALGLLGAAGLFLRRRK